MQTSQAKPFDIPKQMVWEAYRQVAANKGAPGVGEETLGEFEADLKNNLFKIWNRMSSGSYFPPPVKAVEIPKPHGGVRVLGVPTVADRVAQTVVAMHLGERAESRFHPDSYGYRPGKSALDAVGVCRKRCWKFDWVIDLDVQKFFDTVPWDLVVKAVEAVTTTSWVLLYVKRWLKAPLQLPDGTLSKRDKGTPQGSAVSPVLANLFMHFAFDAWMARSFPDCPFERYADKRRDDHDHTGFTFLGFALRARKARNRYGQYFSSFLPAMSPEALKAKSVQLRSMRLHRRIDLTLGDLARWLNPIVGGWLNYYGRFYWSQMAPFLQRINSYLRRWARNKYRRLRTHKAFRRWWAGLLDRQPSLFRHWKWVKVY